MPGLAGMSFDEELSRCIPRITFCLAGYCIQGLGICTIGRGDVGDDMRAEIHMLEELLKGRTAQCM